MASILWWRSWHGAPMDHKWPVVAARAGVKVGVVSAVAWALFDYASQNEPRGSVTGFDEESYSVYSGFTQDEIHAVITAMTDKGIIETDGTLCNWAKRQPSREDNSSERVARYREMKRNVTQCNAEAEDVTLSSVSVSVSESLSNSVSLSESVSDSESKRPEIFTIYEHEIGALTPMIADELIDASGEYSDDWVADALRESARQNKRSWAYARAILKRRKADGGRVEKKPAVRKLRGPNDEIIEVEA